MQNDLDKPVVSVYKSVPPAEAQESHDSDPPDDRFYMVVDPMGKSSGYIEVIGRYRIALKWLNKLELIVIKSRGKTVQEVRSQIEAFIQSIESETQDLTQ
jgi:hypothetical protein